MPPLQSSYLSAIAELERLVALLRSLGRDTAFTSSTTTTKSLVEYCQSLSSETIRINYDLSSLSHFATGLSRRHSARSLTASQGHSSEVSNYSISGQMAQSPSNGDQKRSSSLTRSRSGAMRRSTGRKG